jgi:hypothetical protein
MQLMAQVENDAGPVKNRVAVRSYDGAWGNWSEIYTNKTIVGTVSQTAGVPTGAVIERGSNANGNYARFADGSQICTREITFDPTQSTGYTSYSFAGNFTDRAATSLSFSASNAGANKSTMASMYSVGGTSSFAIHHYAANGGTPFSINIMAFGRWF